MVAWRGPFAAPLGIAALLAPDPAAACATCTSSAFGDLSFTWPHVALLLLPLVVAGGMGGVIAYCYRRVQPDSDGSRAPEPPGAEPAGGARPSAGGIRPRGEGLRRGPLRQ
jgi:hypothetical protein